MGQLVDPNPPPSSRFADLPSPEAVNLGDGIDSYHDLPTFGLMQHAVEQVPDRDFVIYGGQRFTFDLLNQDSIRDGYLHTGDLAVKDADEPSWIIGLQKDLIVKSGSDSVGISKSAQLNSVPTPGQHRNLST
jgi:hypothetical protein